jgi:voltage-gated potassium channel Kch
VFYGDATRVDLLHAAGAARARALVVAIDDIDDSLKLVGRRAQATIPTCRSWRARATSPICTS